MSVFEHFLTKSDVEVQQEEDLINGSPVNITEVIIIVLVYTLYLVWRSLAVDRSSVGMI